MKIAKLFLILLVLGVLLYLGAVYLGFNLPIPSFMEDNIEGDAQLTVTLLMDNNVNDPLANIEVNLAPEPGKPPKGGVALTDDKGVATFNIKPGDYYIYFNELSFPKNLVMPETSAINVAENVTNEKTILVTTPAR